MADPHAAGRVGCSAYVPEHQCAKRLTLETEAPWIIAFMFQGWRIAGATSASWKRNVAIHNCAQKIEVILQREYEAIKPGEIRAILSHNVAHEMGADSEQVRRIICRVQGGSNGVTFSKPPLPGEPWAHERPPTDRPSADQGASDDLSSDGQVQLG